MFRWISGLSLALLLLSFLSHADSGLTSEKGDTMKFGMQGVITATPGKGKELTEIMLQASRLVAGLDGCELYIVQRSVADESKVLITEVWDSKQSHQASLKNSEVRSLIEKAKPIIAGMEHHPAEYVGGHGL